MKVYKVKTWYPKEKKESDSLKRQHTEIGLLFVIFAELYLHK